jgi:hypothetical protein
LKVIETPNQIENELNQPTSAKTQNNNRGFPIDYGPNDRGNFIEVE